MSCEKWREVDLVEYLGSPDAAAFAEYRAHVEGCGDCRGEVSDWKVMLRSLAGGGASVGHPSPESLLRWADAPDARTSDGAAIASHLAACRTCTDEIAALRSFDFTRIAPPSTAGRPARVPARAGLRLRLRDRLGGWEMRPAYALAAGAVAVVLVRWMWPQAGTTMPEPGPGAAPSVQIARVEPPSAPAGSNLPALEAESGAPQPTAEVPTTPPLEGLPAARAPSDPAATEDRAVASGNAIAKPGASAGGAPAASRDAKPGEPAGRAPAASSATKGREKAEPSPEAANAIARSEPRAAPTHDATAAAQEIVRDFLAGRGEAAKPAQGEPSAIARADGAQRGVWSSARGFEEERSGGDPAWSVVALDGSQRATVTGVGRGVRLRVPPPQGSEADAAVRVTIVGPGGERWTGDASGRSGSSWREVQIPGEQLRERGSYAIAVSTVDAGGEARAYDGLLEVR